MAENIYQKLAKVRRSVEVVEKNKSGYGYKYVSEDEILARISGVMDKQGLTLIPSIVPGTFKAEPYVYTKTKSNKDETVTEIIAQADMEFRWINNEDPTDFLVVPWAMVGHQADGSQGFGSALTYAYRYFLLKFFGVATTTDDPDNWRSKQKEAADAEEKATAEKIIEVLDEKIRLYIAAHPDKGESVKSVVQKYAKSGEYKKIKSAKLAAKLLEEFETTFTEENT